MSLYRVSFVFAFVIMFFEFVFRYSYGLGQPFGCPVALFIQFLCHVEAEADAVDETGLLMAATETAGSIDDLVFFLAGFTGHRLIKLAIGLLDLVGVLVAVPLVIGAAKHS